MNAYLNLPHQASLVLIQLCKGVIYQDVSPELWRDLLTYQASIHDYFVALGLQVRVDENEGYAFLHQRPADAEDKDGEDAPALPRLVSAAS